MMNLTFIRSGPSHSCEGAHAAFPPNSNDSFLSVPLLCFMRRRPTGVDPVNEILETLTLHHNQLQCIGPSEAKIYHSLFTELKTRSNFSLPFVHGHNVNDTRGDTNTLAKDTHGESG